MKHRRSVPPAVRWFAVIALGAFSSPVRAAEIFTAVSLERPCVQVPGAPQCSGNASSTTGLTEIIGDADNLGRADVMFTPSFGILRVEARANRPFHVPPNPNPSFAVSARATYTENWVTSLGLGAPPAALGVIPRIRIRGIAGPIPNGDLRLAHTLYAVGYDALGNILATMVLVDVQVTIHQNGAADGEVCPVNAACTPLAIAPAGTSAYDTVINLPIVSVGCSFPMTEPGPFGCPDGSPLFDPDFFTHAGMIETSSVRAAMDPDEGQSGVIDFFHTIESSLQSLDPATDSAWTSDTGRALVPAEGTAAPVADAGPDLSVDEGTLVSLDGTGSAGAGLTFAWSQIAGPAATLSDPASPTPTFTAPSLAGGVDGNQTLSFLLAVSSAAGSDSDSVDVTVRNVNHDPTAEAGSDQTVHEGSLVTLDGLASFDADGDAIVSYDWVQTGGPAVTLSGASAGQATFTAPFLPGGIGASVDRTFTLTVSDGERFGVDDVVVTVEQLNHAPAADAGLDQTRSERSVVTLDGTGSADPDDDPLTYAWSQVAGPTVTLSDPASAKPTFTAPDVEPGGATLTFELVVGDGAATSDPSRTNVTVVNLDEAPICDAARPSQAVLWPPSHKLAPIEILGVTYPANTQVTIAIDGVTQDEPVGGLGDGDSSPDAVVRGGTALLRAERAERGNGRVYEVRFTASDAQGGRCSGSIRVSVPSNMKRGTSAIDDGQDYDATLP